MNICVKLESFDREEFSLKSLITNHPTHSDAQYIDIENVISLKDLPLKDQERLIIKDLFYVFLGYEGTYLKYSKKNQMKTIVDKLKGPKYSYNREIDVRFRDTLNALCNIGKQYYAISHFIQTFENNLYGSVMQRFCQQLQINLTRFDNVIGDLKDSYNSYDNFKLTNIKQQIESLDIIQELSHLYHIIRFIVSEEEKRSEPSANVDIQFDYLMTALKDDVSLDADGNNLKFDEIIFDSRPMPHVKGGVILNFIQDEIDNYKGDLKSKKFLHALYDATSEPFIKMLNEWLLNGNLNDYYNEFAIVETDVGNDNTDVSAQGWKLKYALRSDGLLSQFADKEIQQCILLTGRNLTMIKTCIGKDINIDVDIDFNVDVNTNNNKSQPFFTSFQSLELLSSLNEAYKRSNEKLCKVLLNDYSLTKVIKQTYEWYLIKGESSKSFDDLFSVYLGQFKRPYLTSSKQDKNFNKKLKKSEIAEINNAIKLAYKFNQISNDPIDELFHNGLKISWSSNSIFEEILSLVELKAMDANKVLSSKNMGALTSILRSMNSGIQNSSVFEIEKFTKMAISHLNILIYLPFPYNQIIEDSQQYEFGLLFRHLSLLLYIDKRYQRSWREMGYSIYWTWGYQNKKIENWIRKCRLIHVYFSDFIRIYNSFIKLNVLNKNWIEMEKILTKLENFEYLDVQQVKSTLKEFLSSTMTESLLASKSLCEQIYQILSLSIFFHDFIMQAKKSLCKMDSELVKDGQFDYQWTLEKIDHLRSTSDSYLKVFIDKIRQLVNSLEYTGEMDNSRVLLFKDDLKMAFRF